MSAISERSRPICGSLPMCEAWLAAAKLQTSQRHSLNITTYNPKNEATTTVKGEIGKDKKARVKCSVKLQFNNGTVVVSCAQVSLERVLSCSIVNHVRYDASLPAFHAQISHAIRFRRGEEGDVVEVRCSVGSGEGIVDASSGSHLLLVHADGVLGLVEDAVILVRVGGTGGLVLHGLAGGLLAVWNDVAVKDVSAMSRTKDERRCLPLSLVAETGDSIAGLVDGGLGGVRRGLVREF